MNIVWEILTTIPTHILVDFIIATAVFLAAVLYFYVRVVRKEHVQAKRLLEAVLGKQDQRSKRIVASELAEISRGAIGSRVFEAISNKEPYDVLLTTRARIEHELCRGTLGTELVQGRIWTKSSRNIFLRKSPSKLPTIVVEQVGVLTEDTFKTNVSRYLDSLPEGTKPEFVSNIEIEEAYVSPLLLLGGLLEHLKEQWSPIIREFGRDTSASDDALPKKLRLLQAFIYDCWLIWGPSIPICGDKCENWEGADISVLQLGYGDENNSIILVGAKDALGKHMATIAKKQTPAFRARVTGRLSSPNHVSNKDKSLFYYALKQALAADNRRLVLDVGNNEAGVTAEVGSDKDDRSLYYSAYLWVMLVILDGKGKILGEEQLRSAPWRAWLPFFEHANIADRRTYKILMRQLARKVVATIDSLAEELKLDGSDIRFGYACALDDPGCHANGKPHGLAFPWNAETSLRDELALAIKDASYINRDPAAPKPLFDLDWATQGTNGDENVFSACNLTKLIGSYYQSLEARSQ